MINKRKAFFWVVVVSIPLLIFKSCQKKQTDLVSPLINSESSSSEEVQPSPSEKEEVPSPPPNPSLKPSPIPTPTPVPSPNPSPSPIPLPSPSPVTVSDETLNSFFSKYSSQYGVDEELLKRIAQCESEMNPQAVNGDYVGLFQFASSTWSTTRIDMGMDSNLDLRLNGEESIRTAAYKIAHGGQGAWPNCQ